MRLDKCRIGFILEPRHPIIIKVNSKQKSYYLNTDLVICKLFVKSKEPGWINGIGMIKPERNQMNLSVD